MTVIGIDAIHQFIDDFCHIPNQGKYDYIVNRLDDPQCNLLELGNYLLDCNAFSKVEEATLYCLYIRIYDPYLDIGWLMDRIAEHYDREISGLLSSDDNNM